MGVVLKVLVKKGPLGIHFPPKWDPNQTGNLHMAIVGAGMLNNYHICAELLPGIFRGGGTGGLLKFSTNSTPEVMDSIGFTNNFHPLGFRV